MIMMYQRRFINCLKKKKQVPLWWEDVDNGGSYVCEGQEIYGKSWYFFLNFAVNLKLLLKKVLKK